MSRVTLFPFAAATLLVLAAGAGPARAQAPDGLIIRSFVSAGGNDANGCTRPAPCRTLSAALAKTAAGGTISIVDAGGYGTVTIDKTISIVNDGAGTASILVPQGEIGVFVKDPFYEARVSRGARSGHWPRWQLGASPIGWIRGKGPAGA